MLEHMSIILLKFTEFEGGDFLLVFLPQPIKYIIDISARL